MNFKYNFFFTFIVLLIISCSGTQKRPRNIGLRPLEQQRAIEIILEVLAKNEITETEINVPLLLPNGKIINSDIFVLSRRMAVEYLTEQDRREYGKLPQKVEGSDFHVIIAKKEGLEDEIYLLILNDSDFEYCPNPEPNYRTPQLPTIYEVEDRLRQNIRDFIIAQKDLLYK